MSSNLQNIQHAVTSHPQSQFTIEVLEDNKAVIKTEKATYEENNAQKAVKSVQNVKPESCDEDLKTNLDDVFDTKTFDASILQQNNQVVNFTTRTHKFKRLFCTEKTVLDAGFKDFQHTYVRFILENLMNTHILVRTFFSMKIFLKMVRYL